MMEGNHVLLSPQLSVLCRIFASAIPERLVHNLEISASNAEAKLCARNNVNDTRGAHTCVRFGSCIERGGSGSVRISQDNKYFADFINANNELWDFVSTLAFLFCPEIIPAILKVPNQHRIFTKVYRF